MVPVVSYSKFIWPETLTCRFSGSVLYSAVDKEEEESRLETLFTCGRVSITNGSCMT